MEDVLNGFYSDVENIEEQLKREYPVVDKFILINMHTDKGEILIMPDKNHKIPKGLTLKDIIEPLWGVGCCIMEEQIHMRKLYKEIRRTRLALMLALALIVAVI